MTWSGASQLQVSTYYVLTVPPPPSYLKSKQYEAWTSLIEPHNERLKLIVMMMMMIMMMMMMMMMMMIMMMMIRWIDFVVCVSDERFLPTQVSDTPRAGFVPTQSLGSGLVESSCEAMINTPPRYHKSSSGNCCFLEILYCVVDNKLL